MMEEVAGRMGEIDELEFLVLETPFEVKGSGMNFLAVQKI